MHPLFKAKIKNLTHNQISKDQAREKSPFFTLIEKGSQKNARKFI